MGSSGGCSAEGANGGRLANHRVGPSESDGFSRGGLIVDELLRSVVEFVPAWIAAGLAVFFALVGRYGEGKDIAHLLGAERHSLPLRGRSFFYALAVVALFGGA